MPDSWIDRKELDELVGSLPLSKKRRRRVPPSAGRGVEREPVAGEAAAVADSAPVSEGPPAPDVILELGKGEPAIGEPAIGTPELADRPGDPEIGGIEPLAEAVPVVSEGFDIRSETGAGEHPTVAEAEEAEQAVEPETADGVLPPEILVLAEIPELPEPRDKGSAEAAAEGSPVPSAESDPKPPAMEAAAAPADFPEIVLGGDGTSAPREIPEFLGAPEEWPSPRPSTLSERDADRALVALAEARARAERSRLLRIRDQPVPTTPPVGEGAEGGADPSSDPAPGEGPTLAEDTKEAEERAETPGVEPPGTLLDRIGSYTDFAKRHLGAVDVVVCDRDGFLLHRLPDVGGADRLAAPLLLEVSQAADRLLGLEDSRAIQVFSGEGGWRCLIRGGNGNRGLFAAFLMGRPLECDEVETWTRGLSAALEPHASPGWDAFVIERGLERADVTAP